MASCILGCEKPASDVKPTPALTKGQSHHFALIQAGETGPARIRIRQQIDAGSRDSRSFFLMGLAHHWDRHYAEAANWFERAEAAEPLYPPAAHFRGWALYHSGRSEESRVAFERHLNLVPTEGDSHFALGVLAIERGDLDNAEARLRTAIELQKDDPTRRHGHAKALARMSEVIEQRSEDLTTATALLATAVAEDPDLYEAHFRLARLLRRMGRPEAAEAAELAGHEAQARVESKRVRP